MTNPFETGKYCQCLEGYEGILCQTGLSQGEIMIISSSFLFSSLVHFIFSPVPEVLGIQALFQRIISIKMIFCLEQNKKALVLHLNVSKLTILKKWIKRSFLLILLTNYYQTNNNKKMVESNDVVFSVIIVKIGKNSSLIVVT